MYYYTKIVIYCQYIFTQKYLYIFKITLLSWQKIKKIRTKPKKQEYSQSNASPRYTNTITKYVLTSMSHFGRINVVLSRTGRCHNTVGGYPPLQGVILLYPLSWLEGGGKCECCYIWGTVPAAHGSHHLCQFDHCDHKKEVTAGTLTSTAITSMHLLGG